MDFESVFIKHNNFYINIDNKAIQKMYENSLFLASKVGRPLKQTPAYDKRSTI